ncbi:DUF2200 domain-containing protein [Corynebacterium aquilae]|uniref:DUF2200 domain-containing protein n=1 Tax=Corynebacterium aquilae DSM 44791 TaxID=1431546 RepID=A0A1L7CEV1_9CORY|nr:DUF2200 domain-containing protein [Corynebacterium aquilae]APT84392.1 hypothetical protein CAQU_04130 [Corynebacterium aquilae DSM 44791]
MNARLFAMRFADLYPAYVNKAEGKGRTRDEVDTIIAYATGVSSEDLHALVEDPESSTTVGEFFDQATLPANAHLITGSVCGVKVQEVDDPTMKKIRILDELIDELAKGKAMEKILR